MDVAHTFKVIDQAKVVAFVCCWDLHAHIRCRINLPVKMNTCRNLEIWGGPRVLILCLCLPDFPGVVVLWFCVLC